ncbi:CopD family protein [Kutzneria viridogrisea]|uniref:Copper resistance transporter n=2 Tax=Kutzneria TaxID=43356 RepID=W5VYA8_9PSEU|nr:CopD family protein [Kutzneria albida]AHH93420.1 copper resistance transporter [Kutzneria albida DSM 43870]MBA8929195.1 putative copper resistance protein D [Kutzneria viridogrisea]
MTATRTTARNGYGLVGGLVLAAVAGALIGTSLTGETPVPGVAEPGVVVRFGLPLVRVLLDVSALGTVGLSLLPMLLGFDRPTQTEPVLRLARRAAVITSAGWVVGALLSLVFQTADLHPDQGPTIGSIVDYVRTIGAGQALVISAVVALIYLGFAVLAVRHGESVPAELRVVLSVFGLLPIPVTGHASNFGLAWGGHGLTMVSMELHVMAAAGWTGGLAALGVLVASNRTLLATALPKFSKLATLCIAVVGVTGLVNAFLTLYETPGVDPVGGLFTTHYGWIVLGKLACFAVLAALGANIRFRLLPLIVQHQRVSALVSWISLEVAVMGLAYGLAVVLTRAPVA